MGGYITSKHSKSIIITPKHPHLSGNPKFSYPPYLINGDRLWWDYCTNGIRTLENGGVGHLKIQKKKPNFGGDTHVTLNPKTLNLGKTSYNSIFLAKPSHISIFLAKLGITP